MAVTIELYLIRHAIAAERGPNYPDDKERPLTSEGIARFKQSVEGLKELEVSPDLILTSPLVRATQTTDLLVAGLPGRARTERVDALAPGARIAAVVEEIEKWAKRYRRIVLVGHEPEMGEIAAKLLQARGEIEFKKGAVCCIELDGALPKGPGILRWLLPPRALRKLAR